MGATRTGCNTHTMSGSGVLGEVLSGWAPSAHYHLLGPKASKGENHKDGGGGVRMGWWGAWTT